MSYTKGKWRDIESATCEPNARAVVNEDGVYICDCYSLGADSCQAEPEEAEGNAERIVQCVNSHDDLLEAHKKVRRIVRKTKNAVGITLGIHSELCKMDKIIQQAISNVKVKV